MDATLCPCGASNLARRCFCERRPNSVSASRGRASRGEAPDGMERRGDGVRKWDVPFDRTDGEERLLASQACVDSCTDADAPFRGTSPSNAWSVCLGGEGAFARMAVGIARRQPVCVGREMRRWKPDHTERKGDPPPPPTMRESRLRCPYGSLADGVVTLTSVGGWRCAWAERHMVLVAHRSASSYPESSSFLSPPWASFTSHTNCAPVCLTSISGLSLPGVEL